MTTTFHELAKSRGANMLRKAFSQRESNGNENAVLYIEPDQEPRELFQVNVSNITLTLLSDDRTGNMVKREIVQLRVPREYNNLDANINRNAQFLLPVYGERIWAVQAEQSQVGHYWNLYYLERRPLARYDEKIDASNR